MRAAYAWAWFGVGLDLESDFVMKWDYGVMQVVVSMSMRNKRRHFDLSTCELNTGTLICRSTRAGKES